MTADHFKAFISTKIYFVLAHMADKRKQITTEVKVKKKAKRQVTKDTFIKRQKYQRDYQFITWLKCTYDLSNKSLVSTLWCQVCQKL